MEKGQFSGRTRAKGWCRREQTFGGQLDVVHVPLGTDGTLGPVLLDSNSAHITHGDTGNEPRETGVRAGFTLRQGLCLVTTSLPQVLPWPPYSNARAMSLLLL